MRSGRQSRDDWNENAGPRAGGAKHRSGFAYVEALVGLALLLIVSAPVLQVAAGARRLTQSQAEATDLHQRARVAADKLQRDVTMAGAGPLHSGVVGSLASYLPPVLPARTGVRAPDPALSAHGDRLTVLFVPEGGWSAPLVRPTTDPRAGIAISPAGSAVREQDSAASPQAAGR